MTTGFHSHVHTPFPVGPHTLYATASASLIYNPAVAKGYAPKELAFYLDIASWSRLRGAAPVSNAVEASCLPTLTDAQGSVVYVPWPDLGAIDLRFLQKLLGLVLKALGEGRTVEIGCIAAHGRTGSLLASLLVVVEGLGAAQAIQRVRGSYCPYAIESQSQRRMIHDLAGEGFDPCT